MTSHRPRLGLTGHGGVLGTCLQREFPNAEWVTFPGDVRNYEEVCEWVNRSMPLNGLIHLAAMVPISKVEAQPQAAFQTNVGGTCHILEAVRQATTDKAPCWIFLGSTSHVYASSDHALTEDSPLRPISLYGFTKWQAEELALLYAKKYAMRICIGRIFSYSSALQPSSYLLPSLVTKIQSAPPGASLEIPGLHGVRDFIGTHQICEAIQFLFQKGTIGPINIASGAPTKLLDIALRIRSKLAREDVSIDALEAGTATLYADTSRLEDLGLKLPTEMDSLINEVLVARTGGL